MQFEIPSWELEFCQAMASVTDIQGFPRSTTLKKGPQNGTTNVKRGYKLHALVTKFPKFFNETLS